MIKRARYDVVQLQRFLVKQLLLVVEFLFVMISFVLLVKLSVSICVGNLGLKNDLTWLDT